MSGTNACKETVLQQLSHGCAPHTNEGIDRFLRSAAVVFSKPSWCANLQLLQGLINISRSYTHVHTVFFKHFLIPVRNYRSFSLYNVYNSIGVTSIAHKKRFTRIYRDTEEWTTTVTTREEEEEGDAQ